MTIKNYASMFVKYVICTSITATGALRLYRHYCRRGNLIILMYHKINNQDDPLGLTISPDFFIEQIKYLVEQYTIISLAEAVSRLVSDTIDKDYVVITFDDGYRDNYTFAYPILQRYSVPVTIFVTHDAIESGSIGWYQFDTAIIRSLRKDLDLTFFDMGRYSLKNYNDKAHALVELHRQLKRLTDEECREVIAHVLFEHSEPGAAERIMLSWEEIREMHQSGLVTIGAHTLTHPILTQVSRNIALMEICESKRLVEKKAGCSVEFFAYPNGSRGDFDEEIIAMVKQCGYRAACSTISGEHFEKIDIYSLPRTDVTENICRGICGKFSRGMFSVKVSGMLDGILFRS